MVNINNTQFTSGAFFLAGLGFSSGRGGLFLAAAGGFSFSSFLAFSFFFLVFSNSRISSGQSRLSSGSQVLSEL
jgi:hypothetical protein